MPHIVLEKAKSVKECYDAIEPMMQQLEKGILKITNKYIDYKENSALIESISIEDGKTQNFFIQLSSKGEAVTVRLFPLTDPEKTKGVKTLMGIVAKKIKDSNAQINYGKTNLQDFLIE
ncbi:hypothetical protein [Arcobacter sp.]|uniref:hypothetical protein n=1 Tax=unclassified Arcobacter TaxID=2593671 RepID=UPI003AFFF801